MMPDVTDRNASPVSAPDPASEDARWQARYRAARVALPGWARDRPSRCVYVANTSGVFEVHTWDRDTDEHRQVTDRPQGTTHATVDRRGEHVWWFADTDGDEFGVWMRQPYEGSTPDAVEAVPGLPPSYPAGLRLGREVTVVGRAGEHGCSVHVVHGGGEPVEVYRSAEDASVGGLSEDGTLLAVEHSEHGDSLHPALRVLRLAPASGVRGGPTGAGDAPASGASAWPAEVVAEVVAELADGPGKGLHALGFSPVDGDPRLLVGHERRGRPELLLWDPVEGVEREIALRLEGDLTAEWYPDGSALLVHREHAARSTLHRYDLATETLSTVDTLAGMVDGATARPDGTVEYSWSSAAQPPQIRVAGSPVPLLTPPGAPAPPSVPLTDAWVEGPGGPVHALVGLPEGSEGPYPTVFLLHGGPHWLDSDSFLPSRAAWLDAGYAVVHVNYRGSTGYGSAWRDAITGRPGLTELEDVAAVHDWALAGGLVDPARCVLAGRSWGGYLTLLGLGTQPSRWSAGVAGVPVADYVAAYEDEMEQLQAMDRALFRSRPDEAPEVWAASSPITYADRVRVPLLVTAGLNDPRCPIRQIDNYLARLRELGTPYEEYRYDAGHGSMVVEEAIRMTAAELGFVRAHVPAW